MGKIVSQTELCEIIGVTAKTVNSWIDKGFPVLERAGHGTKSSYDTEQCIGWLIQREIGRLAVLVDGTVYNFEAEKARLTHEQAEKVAMENMVRRGELVDTEKVAGWWASIITNAKQRLLAIPTKAAPLVLGLKTLPEVRDQLETTINEVLLELSTTDPVAGGGGDEGMAAAAEADGEPVGGPQAQIKS